MPAESRSRRNRRSRPLVLRLELALCGAAALLWWLWPADRPGAAKWLSGEAASAIEPFATLATELPLALELELTRPMHVHVASWDVVRGTIAMFPSAMLRTDLPANPLPAGHHRLPGTHDGVQLQWHVGDGVGATSFVLIVSDRPLPELSEVLATCRQMGNAAFPKRAILGTYAPAGGMDSTPPRHRPAGALLAAACELLDPLHDGAFVGVPGHPGVYAKVLRVTTPVDGPAVDEARAREQIRGRLGALETMLPTDASVPAPARGN